MIRVVIGVVVVAGVVVVICWVVVGTVVVAAAGRYHRDHKDDRFNLKLYLNTIIYFD